MVIEYLRQFGVVDVPRELHPDRTHAVCVLPLLRSGHLPDPDPRPGPVRDPGPGPGPGPGKGRTGIKVGRTRRANRRVQLG